MKRILLALSLCAIAPSVDGAPAIVKYAMKGPCHVRTTEGVPFDETFDRELEAAISGPDDHVKIIVSGKDHAPCTLEGKRVGALITLTPLQACAQKVTKDRRDRRREGRARERPGRRPRERPSAWSPNGTSRAP